MAGKHVCQLVHFVWSTAGREPWISAECRERLNGFLGGVLEHKNGKLIRAGGMPDHVHIFASLPSTLSLADAVNILKSNSSRWIHQTFPKMRGFAWQRGYGAFSVSKSAEGQIINYVMNQETHHRGRGFREEFLSLLSRHGVEYDERYLWD